jgi:hypothetical protein
VVNHSTGWGLGHDAGDPTNGESDSHALLVPPISCQVDREEWSDSRLNVREKKIQPIQTAQRSDGRRFGPSFFRSVRGRFAWMSLFVHQLFQGRPHGHRT